MRTANAAPLEQRQQNVGRYRRPKAATVAFGHGRGAGALLSQALST